MEFPESLKGYELMTARPAHRFSGVDKALAAGGVVGSSSMTIDGAKFKAYQEANDYQTNFPKYWDQFGRPGVWERKQLEHFLSIELMAPHKDGTYIDVAAAGSPVADVIATQYGARAYRQDLRWPAGVDEKLRRIGSNANAIPLPDGSVDGIVTHNAIEHFEEHFDRGFMIEAGRLLKPGGVVCIIPFVPNIPGYSVTAPEFWNVKFGKDASAPSFDERLPVVVDNGCRQRLLKIHSPETLTEDCRMADALNWTLVNLTNARDFGFQRAMLVGRKPEAAKKSGSKSNKK